MEDVTLGKTGLKISRLGFGGIPIQRVDAAVTKELAKAMVEKGINYIDTARGYTVSESYIGEALEGIRDKFVLATKSMARTKEAMAADIMIPLAAHTASRVTAARAATSTSRRPISTSASDVFRRR